MREPVKTVLFVMALIVTVVIIWWLAAAIYGFMGQGR
jgi:hypothetical protein